MKHRVRKSWVCAALLCAVMACGDDDDQASDAGKVDAGAAGADAGDGGSDRAGSGGSAGTQGGDDCPPECLRAYECATACGETPVNYGCCPCPDGLIDTITCNDDQNGSCGLPCMGARPDDEVVAACQALQDEADCNAYTGSGFPDHCEWHTPQTPPCLAP